MERELCRGWGACEYDGVFLGSIRACGVEFGRCGGRSGASSREPLSPIAHLTPVGSR